jgi:hypothetical protein
MYSNGSPDAGQQLLVGVSWVVLQVVGDDLTDHGVLAQQDYSVATQSHADVSHLLGSHVVALHNHDLGVGVKQLLQPGEVPCLTLSRQRHAVAVRDRDTGEQPRSVLRITGQFGPHFCSLLWECAVEE